MRFSRREEAALRAALRTIEEQNDRLGETRVRCGDHSYLTDALVLVALSGRVDPERRADALAIAADYGALDGA